MPDLPETITAANSTRPAGGPWLPVIDADRLVIGDEVAHGGMGAVYRAHDPVLGRELAVKVLLAVHQDRPDMLRRFVEEARIAGQLQHPGVPPVHEAGRLPDGRPFIAMKLIQGRTLADLLGERPTPAHDLPRFLQAFEQICQTLAYAHSRGLIHRDLKPVNVMVGEFGEVQVMDWGLAKEMRSAARGTRSENTDFELAAVPHSAPPTPNADVTTPWTIPDPREDTPPEQTRPGSIMGTPAYMPPEQARGEAADERADVFGLGAILCEVLTGRPPFDAPRQNRVKLAASGDLAETFTRLDACGADTDLIALAKQCLAPDRADRPADGAAVASAMTAYLGSVQERLRRAEVERAEAQVKAREERRRRRVTIAFFLAVLVLGGLSAGVWLWWKDREKAAAERAEKARREVEEHEQAARLQEQAAGEKAEAALAEVVEHEQAGRWPAALTSANQALAALAETGNPAIRARSQQAAQDAQLAIDLEAVRLLKTRSIKGRYDVGATDRGFADTFRKHGFDPEGTPPVEFAAKFEGRPRIAERVAVALDEWRQARRVLSADSADMAKLVAVAQALDPDSWRTQLRVTLTDNNREALRQLAGSAPVEQLPAASVLLLSDGLLTRHHWDVDYFDRGIERLRWWLVLTEAGAIHTGIEDPGLSHAASLLRSVILLTDELARMHRTVAVELNLAIALLQRANKVHPGDFWVNHQLGHYCTELTPPDWPRALGYFRAAHAIRPVVHVNLGNALMNTRAVDEAIKYFQDALHEVGLDDVKKTMIHSNIGAGYIDKQDWAAATRSLETAIALNPNDPRAQYNLGTVFHKQNKLEQALAAYQKARALEPFDHAVYYKLALVHKDLGEIDAAIAALLDCTKVSKSGLDDVYFQLGILLTDFKQDGVGGRAAFEQALRFAPNDPVLHGNLGMAFRKLKAWDSAIAAFRKSVQLQPGYARGYYNLADTLKEVGRLDEAIAAYRAALAIRPDFAEVHCDLGHALRAQGKFAEAWDSLKRGHELGSARPDWKFPSARWVREVERYGRAEREVTRVLQGNIRPETLAEWRTLVEYCMDAQRYSTATQISEIALTTGVPGADKLVTSFRYNAACLAIAAGLREGKETDLDAASCARRRALALRWMREELAAWQKQLDSPGPDKLRPVHEAVRSWQRDEILAFVRDEDRLANLPVAERAAWRQFWTDAEALRKAASDKKKDGG